MAILLRLACNELHDYKDLESRVTLLFMISMG